MSDATAPAPTLTCTRCAKTLTQGDNVSAQDRVYCRACYETVKLEVQRAVAGMSEDVNYPMATLGAVLGGIVGVLVWWGFTVMTKLGFGLIAVAIGFLVGHGAARFAGNKRSGRLQAIAVVVGALSFLVAAYLVNMTFINELLAQRGDPGRVPFPPASVHMFIQVLAANFGVMKLVFLAIVVYEAWTIPRPIKAPLP
jgi:hypothetical protein